MTAIKTLLVKFDADTSDGKKGIEGLNNEVDKSRGMFGGAKDAFLGFVSAQAVIGGVKLAWGILSTQIEDTIKAGMDQQKVMADTTAVLKSMGGASGQTAESIGAYADRMAQLTGISDDVIQHSENVMLTFGNIGKQVFPQAETAALNLSSRLGVDLQSATLQVGKALNDPIKGITALTRAGVSFSSQEQESIKTMMAHNDIAGAQKIIMGELDKQFHGAAEAAGNTFDGQLKRLNVTMDQAKEKIGLAVIPALSKMLGAVTPLAQTLGEGLADVLSTKVVPVLDEFGIWFTNDGLPVISKFTAIIESQALPTLEHLASGAQSTVMPAIEQVGATMRGLLPTIEQLGQWVEVKVLPALAQLGTFIVTKILPAWAQFQAFGVSRVVPILETLGNIIITDVIPPLETIWLKVETQLIPVIERLWDKLEPLLIPTLKFLGGILKNVVGPALGFVVDVAGFLINVFTGAIDISEKIAGVFIYMYEQLWNKLKPGFEHVAGVLKTTFKPQLDAIGAQFNWLKGLLGDFLDKLGQVKDAIGNTFSGLGSAAHKMGIPGFAEGTDSAPGGLAWVGEHGKELMYVPRGAQILPHDESARLSSAAASARSSLSAAAAYNGPTTGSASVPVIRVENHLYLNGRELMHELGPALGDELRAYGLGV